MRRRRNRRGVAALELALCLPALLLVVLGTADLGLAILGMSRLTAAVAAGAHYATMKGSEVDAGAVSSLIQAAASATTATVDTSRCYCIASAASGPTLLAGTCSDGCAGGLKARPFAIIQATWTHTRLTPVTILSMPASFTVAARVPLR